MYTKRILMKLNSFDPEPCGAQLAKQKHCNFHISSFSVLIFEFFIFLMFWSSNVIKTHPNEVVLMLWTYFISFLMILRISKNFDFVDLRVSKLCIYFGRETEVDLELKFLASFTSKSNVSSVRQILWNAIWLNFFHTASVCLKLSHEFALKPWFSTLGQ